MSRRNTHPRLAFFASWCGGFSTYSVLQLNVPSLILYADCLDQGDCTKAKKDLGWVPEITFQELVKDMMKADIANVDAGNEHA